MRTGIIVRANKRGLRYQTEEAAKNYPFDAQLLVLDRNKRWPEDLSLFPKAVLTTWNNGHLDEAPLRQFLDAVDVIFSVETLYERDMPDIAKAYDVKTVIQGNPEFLRVERGDHQPDRWTWPTPWYLDWLPPGEVVPVPSMESPVKAADPYSEPFTVLHVAGHRPLGDRNGTDLFLHALRQVQRPCVARIIGQDGEIPHAGLRMPVHVDLQINPHGVDDRWDMYAGAHLLMSPRRYGGLSLPVIEAASSGLAIAMSGCEPNLIWPIVPMPTNVSRGIKVPLGSIRTHAVHPRVIARTMDRLNADRAFLAAQMEQSTQWAEEHSWERLHSVYTRLLTEW